MNATVMSNSEIGENSIVGGNSFVPYHKKFPAGSIIAGSPAKVLRKADEKDSEAGKLAPKIYKQLVKLYSEKRIIGYKKDNS